MTQMSLLEVSIFMSAPCFFDGYGFNYDRKAWALLLLLPDCFNHAGAFVVLYTFAVCLLVCLFVVIGGDGGFVFCFLAQGASLKLLAQPSRMFSSLPSTHNFPVLNADSNSSSVTLRWAGYQPTMHMCCECLLKFAS
jgi:hypothetical protein